MIRCPHCQTMIAPGHLMIETILMLLKIVRATTGPGHHAIIDHIADELEALQEEHPPV